MQNQLLLPFPEPTVDVWSLQGKPDVAGVYKITCAVTSKIYIGSSVTIYNRCCQHRQQLRRGTHGNSRLQRAWNEYGESVFRFEVVEGVSRENEEVATKRKCICREQHYLDTLRPYLKGVGYNVCEMASMPLGLTMVRRWIVTHPGGQEECVRNLAAFCRKHQINNSNLHAVALGKAHQHKGFRCRYYHVTAEEIDLASKVRRASYASCSEYQITKPNGDRLTIANLSLFCKENHLNYNSMQNGGAFGWKCKKVKSRSPRQQATSEWIVTHPNGYEENVVGLREFCLLRNLTESAMRNVANNRQQYHKGFQCRPASMTKEEWVARRQEWIKDHPGNSADWFVTFPNGKEERITSLLGFCKEHGLSSACMRRIADGKMDQHKGFCCRRASVSKEELASKVSKRRNERPGNAIGWIVTHPDGREEEVVGLPWFCNLHKLNPTGLRSVALGLCDQHKGYRCRRSTQTRDEWWAAICQRKKNDGRKKTWEVVSPKGDTVVTSKLSQFCLDHNVNYKCLTSKKQWRGWSIRSLPTSGIAFSAVH